MRLAVEADKPQLCPDPGPDVAHGASDRSIAYQAQISALNNPQRPLAPGLAVSLINPVTGKRVVYDDCRESDGTMIEAKGPGFAKMLRSKYFGSIRVSYAVACVLEQSMNTGGAHGPSLLSGVADRDR
jgi:hypothetical protein